MRKKRLLRHSRPLVVGARERQVIAPGHNADAWAENELSLPRSPNSRSPRSGRLRNVFHAICGQTNRVRHAICV
jgi:hypothetical protein